MDFLTIMETTEADVPEGQVSSVPTVAATVTVDHRHSFRPLLMRCWMNLVTELCILYFAVPSPSRPRCTSSRNVTVADLLAGANLNEPKHENVTAHPANPLFKGSGRDFREPKKNGWCHIFKRTEIVFAFSVRVDELNTPPLVDFSGPS